MNESHKMQSEDKVRPNKPALFFFVAITLAMVGVISIGYFVETELFSRLMYYIPQRCLPPLDEFYPYQIGLTLLFAFGVPLGMTALYTHAIVRTEPKSRKRRMLIAAGFFLFALVVLVPVFFRWNESDEFFGVSGFLILFSVISFFWFTSHLRAGLDTAQRSAFDFKVLGYLCFGIVTWHICGFGNSPCFALFPEKMLRLGVRPFAVGQLKSIMAYFVFGWIFTAIGFYKSLSINRRGVRDEIPSSPSHP